LKSVIGMGPKRTSGREKTSGRNKFIRYIMIILIMKIHSMCYGIVSAIILTAALGVGTVPSIYAQSSTNSPSSGSLKGSLTSLQNDATDNSTQWIVSGVFKMNNVNATATAAAPATANATFYMMKTDGTSPHKHQVYDFKSSGQPSTSGNFTVINGTSTVTMKDGPVQDVPTSITILDGNAISIWFDPSKVNNHFGYTPIYGTQHLICVEEPDYCK
jgi:hypothetical protein